MERHLPIFIGIIGGARCCLEVAEVAEETGRELARRGAILICGGLGGVMEAACRGASQAGGRTIGILPGDDPASANAYVDTPIVTGMGEARNVIIIKSVQAVIAIDGEFGTLSEIGYALRRGIPVIGLNTWSLSRDGKRVDSIILAENAIDAVKKALAAVQKQS
ncbi:MAG TPA: TIGR00725 family protein [Dehalococcoidia bacterium]|nr:TIGR00725 family protein [Dehalococcoidia bacterium]